MDSARSACMACMRENSALQCSHRRQVFAGITAELHSVQRGGRWGELAVRCRVMAILSDQWSAKLRRGAACSTLVCSCGHDGCDGCHFRSCIVTNSVGSGTPVCVAGCDLRTATQRGAVSVCCVSPGAAPRISTMWFSHCNQPVPVLHLWHSMVRGSGSHCSVQHLQLECPEQVDVCRSALLQA